jgi:NAD-dependent SIR2 family protein deacetylase
MAGHVFLVHGHLDKLSCDAWLLPSSDHPKPSSTFRHAVSETAPAGTPATWSDVTGRVLPWQPRQASWPRPWLVYTIESPNAEAARFVESAKEFLEVASKNLDTTPRNNRTVPLLALPVVGAGKGGGAAQAGQIVRVLLPVLYRFTRNHDIDVALVMRDPAQYAAAQAVRAEQGEEAWAKELSESFRKQCDYLAHRANRNEIVLFLGAGVSQAAGLPSWGGLLATLAGPELVNDPAFSKLTPLDQARVVQRFKFRDQPLGPAVKEVLTADHYSLVHGLLAALPAKEVVTTNYDRLFEMASAASGRPVDVLPCEQTEGKERWLLKLHGCVSEPEDIVLTREDYLRYDAGRAALAGLVQGLLITRHMLFVGFSLNDDNFHRIIDAVRRAVRRERLGTSLSVAGNHLLQEVWAKDLDWIEFGGDAASPRVLEIFLDRLAAKTVTTADHLFDDRYAATLSDADRKLRQELEGLTKFILRVPQGEQKGAAWDEVHKLLERLGCGVTARTPSEYAAATGQATSTSREP